MQGACETRRAETLTANKTVPRDISRGKMPLHTVLFIIMVLSGVVHIQFTEQKNSTGNLFIFINVHPKKPTPESESKGYPSIEGYCVDPVASS